MPTASGAEDIYSILSRFSSWAGKQPAGGRELPFGTEGVREVPCEEVLQQIQSRRALDQWPAGEVPSAGKRPPQPDRSLTTTPFPNQRPARAASTSTTP